jgi:polyisoprenoid-binding protein YceI
VTPYEFTRDSVLEIHADSSVHPIHGETRVITGRVEGEVRDGHVVLDPQPTGYFEIPVGALRSGHRLQDLEMRRRIQANRFPTIRYELRRIEGGPEVFRVTGTLAFHGVTREFGEDIRARIDGDTLYAEGEHTLDVNDYDMKPPRILNLQVHPEVRVVMRVVAKEL